MSQAKSTSRSHAPTSWTDPKRPFPKAITAGPASSQTRLPSNDGGASKSGMTSRAAQGSASSINQSSAGLGRTGTVRKPSIWAKIMGDNSTQTRPVQPVQAGRDRSNSTLKVMPSTANKAALSPSVQDRSGQYASANRRSAQDHAMPPAMPVQLPKVSPQDSALGVHQLDMPVESQERRSSIYAPPVNPGVSIQPPPRSSTDPVHSSTHIQLPKSVLRVESNLPQPAEATQLRNEHVALRTLFSNHVQCFYHGDDVRKTLDAATSMQGLSQVGLDDQEARQILQSVVDPSTRHHAIRRLLGYAILRRIQPDILDEVSLLPMGIVRTLEAMSAYKGSQQGQ